MSQIERERMDERMDMRQIFARDTILQYSQARWLEIVRFFLSPPQIILAELYIYIRDRSAGRQWAYGHAIGEKNTRRAWAQATTH